MKPPASRCAVKAAFPEISVVLVWRSTTRRFSRRDAAGALVRQNRWLLMSSMGHRLCVYGARHSARHAAAAQEEVLPAG
jgi:hypothetical protein